MHSLGPKPPLGYTASALQRASELRRDAAAIAALENDPRARAYVVAGERIVLRKRAEGPDPTFTLAAARALPTAAETIFLGLAEGAGRFALAIEAGPADALKARDDLLLVDLRAIAVQGLVAAAHLPPLAAAKALLSWHARHRFCSLCGAPTAPAEAGWRRDCPSCRAEHFPRTDPVVIMLATAGERCLLARQPRFPAGMWSCLAGFVEPGESIEEAVRRETREEAGILCGRVDYMASQPWPFPMSLMIGCRVEALSSVLTIDCSELEDAGWFTRADVFAMLERRHPQGRTAPPPVAIAYHLLRAWAEEGG